jgi:SPP1 gp7 family putative phage head morphogenesis protein
MPTDPTGKVVRNIFALRQYENGLTREVVAQFERSAERLKRILYRLDPTSVSAGRVRARLRRLYRAADAAITQLYSQVSDISVEGLLGVAQTESEFAAGVLETAVGAEVDIETQRIGRGFARSIVQTDPIQGQVMRDWWKKQKATTAFAFRTQVQLGMAQNETIDQIVRRVRGRSVGGGRYVGGVMQTSTRDATALVRTAVNEIATKANFETYAANDDITKKYELVVTFDSRTSDICISLDGRTYAYDDPNRRMPPFHFNCRTTIAPIVDWKGLGLEPPPEGMRASADGPVPAGDRYGDWLKRQSVPEQNKILGRGRAQLWRDGKLELRDLVRTDGSSITLAELEAKLNG